jgi:hypothetical protein
MAMVVSKKPCEPTESEIEDNPEKFKRLAMGLVTPETLLYSALIAANMSQGVDPETGHQSVESSPYILGQALDQWQKIWPDKDPEDHIQRGIVKAGRMAMSETNAPFHKLLKERKNFILPNNGSVN